MHATQLGTIELNHTAYQKASLNSDKQWMMTIMLNETKVINTGVEATTIPAETYKRLGKVLLQEPAKILRGANNSHLSVIGQFTGSLAYKKINCLQDIL